MEVGEWKYGSSSVMEGWDGPFRPPYVASRCVLSSGLSSWAVGANTMFRVSGLGWWTMFGDCVFTILSEFVPCTIIISNIFIKANILTYASIHFSNVSNCRRQIHQFPLKGH